MERSRTERELEELRSENRLRETIGLPPRKPIAIHATGKRTPEENARLVAELEAKLYPKT